MKSQEETSNNLSTKDCKYCCSPIPLAAKKCGVCLEWQETRKDEKKIYQDQYLTKKEFLETFGHLKTPFQYVLVRWMRTPYYVAIFLLVALLFSGIQIAWYLLEEDKDYLFSFAAYSMQMMVSIGSVIWVYKAINRDNRFFLRISRMHKDISKPKQMKKAIREFKSFNAKIFNRTGALLTGLIIGIVTVIGEQYIGLPFKTETAKYLFLGFAFINMFFGGAVIYSMVQFGLYIFKISTLYKKNGFLTLEQKRATGKIGELHLRSAILAIVPLGMGIIAKIFGNWMVNMEVIAFYAAFALFITIYIFWPMENIHQLLYKDREVQIIAIQMKIRKKLEEISTNLSSSNLAKISELRELEKKTSMQRTWPFDTKGLWLVFVATIFPILLVIIDKIWFS